LNFLFKNQEYASIVRWADNGKAFVVKKLPEFIEDVLPNYFKHNNFASFVRQLNMYDFHKTRNSSNESIFYHKLFNKGQKHLLKLIKRKINNNLSHGAELITEDSELTEVIKDDLKNEKSKKHLEELYFAVLRQIEDLNRKQTELENRVEILTKKNEAYERGEICCEELFEKRICKNLEGFINLILESLSKRNMLNIDSNLKFESFDCNKENFVANPSTLRKCYSTATNCSLDDKNNYLNTKSNNCCTPLTKYEERIELDCTMRTKQEEDNLPFYNNSGIKVKKPLLKQKNSLIAKKSRRQVDNYILRKIKTENECQAEAIIIPKDHQRKNMLNMFDELKSVSPCLLHSPTKSLKKIKASSNNFPYTYFLPSIHYKKIWKEENKTDFNFQKS
jgi:hypothetical protein